MSSSNYPCMSQSELERAPWNQEDSDCVDVNVCVSVSLSKSTTVSVTDYTAIQWEDYDHDIDGSTYHYGGVGYDFSDCNFTEAFSQQDYSPIDLLEILKIYVEADINGSFHTEGGNAKAILSACQGWTTDEMEVIEE